MCGRVWAWAGRGWHSPARHTCRKTQTGCYVSTSAEKTVPRLQGTPRSPFRPFPSFPSPHVTTSLGDSASVSPHSNSPQRLFSSQETAPPIFLRGRKAYSSTSPPAYSSLGTSTSCYLPSSVPSSSRCCVCVEGRRGDEGTEDGGQL